jgi:predicted MFS family arabinose efflux permease
MLRRRVRALLSPLRIPAFRRVWTADVISLLGDWAGRLALTVLVLERTGSPAWAAGVTAVSLIGFVGIGQVLATLADRHGRIAVMIAADLARAACFATMLLDLPVGLLLVLAFLAGLATPPFEAARSAAIPDLVPEDDYPLALALSNISVQSALLVGYALGGLLLSVVDARAALAINAFSFLVSAFILTGLRDSPAAEPGHRNTVGGSLRAAYSSLFGDRLIRRALAVISITGLLGTVMEALVVPYAVHIDVRDGFVGLLAAAVPVGTLIGTAAVSAGHADHSQLLRKAALVTVVSAAASSALFFADVEGFAAFLAFFIGGGMFAVSIPTNTVIGLRLQRDNRATAMGIAVGVLMGSQALGAALGGLAASRVGIDRTIGCSLALAAVFGAWCLVTTPLDARHLRRPSGSRRIAVDPAVDLVAMETEPSGVG